MAVGGLGLLTEWLVSLWMLAHKGHGPSERA